MKRAVLCLALRLIHALLSKTAFAPDEYWQSIEVAHRAVFGYGHLTWEWAAGLRSYVHPALFAALYWALRVTGADSAWLVAKGPALLQAVVAAVTDIHVYRLTRLLFGGEAGRWALTCQLAAWFNTYCLVRTYSSSLEACCVAVGTYHWLASLRPGGAGHPRRVHQRPWILAAAASAVVRPPSILFWAPLALISLFSQPRRGPLMADFITLGGGILAAASVVDRIGYGRWVLVPWEFFRFNLLEGGSAMYGGHPWHWNLSQGLPAVAATLLPLLLVGLAVGRRSPLVYLLALSVGVYSLPAHKEFRFLLPALQLAMPFCGLGAAWLMEGPAPREQAKGAKRGGQGRAGVRWLALVALILAQLPVGLYFSAVQHRGLVEVMEEVRRLAATDPATSVLFLTPCHATPYYTHVHLPIPMRFLDCSPPGWAAPVAALNQASMAWLRLPEGCAASPAAKSQRGCFEADPAAYFKATLGLNRGALPSAVVGFAAALEELRPLLLAHGYRPHVHLANCRVQTDDDTPCLLDVWKGTHV